MAFAHSLSGFRPSTQRELLNSNCIRDRSIESKSSSIESINSSIRWIPRPFHERDLDDDAEEFIVGWAQEFPRRDPVSLVVHVNQLPPHDDAQHLLETAVHNYFAYRAKLNRLEFRHLLKQGRTSLIIGLAFLAACVLTSQLLRRQAGTLPIVLREGLIIAGWVAMWRPMEIFLYEWWPLLRRGRLYEKLSRMRVEVRKRYA